MKLSKEEVLSIITTQPNGNIEEKQFKKKFPELYQEITSLSFPEEFKWTQKLYHFFHDDTDLKLGICPVCSKRCKFQKFNLGYCKHCSYKCTQLDKETQIKIKETCIERYGKEYYTQTDEYKERYEQTCLEKYGVTHSSKSKIVKEKVKETNQERFGVDCSFQSDDIKKKIKETCIERYGKEHYTQTQEYKEKSSKTCLKRYGKETYMQSDDFKQKSKETCIEKYDKEYNSQTNEWFEKTKETCQEKWGVSSYSQTNEWFEKTKETCLEKYGKEYYSQTEIAKERYEKTCLERYGVPNFMQSPESTKYHRKRIEYDGSTFDSTWEVKIYQYCKENDISCEYQPNIIFEYEYEGKKHYYHPDFLINGKIYEVKGDQFFDENGKMINPYDKESDLFEAKHQCMLQNNVIILRGEDIKNLNINIFK